MANHPSAAKRARQTTKRRARNRAGRSELRTAVKKFRTGVEESPEAAASTLSQMQSTIDRSRKRNLIHRNKANRLKSRLAKRLNDALKPQET